MLRAKATMDDGRPFLILGLEHGNLDRLRDGQPILFDLATVGMTGDCLILSGESQAAIVADLEAHGFTFGVPQ